MQVITSAAIVDRPTAISGYGGRYLHDKLTKTGINSELLPDNTATQPMIEKILASVANTDTLFCYYGHGMKDRVCGLIPPKCRGVGGGMINLTNIDLLHEFIVYPTACWTARQLGFASEDIATAYIGFDAPVYVGFKLPDHDYATDFAITWSVVPRELAKGKTVNQAVNKYRRICKAFMRRYDKMSDVWYNADYYIPKIEHNLIHMLVFGNGNATLK